MPMAQKMAECTLRKQSMYPSPWCLTMRPLCALTSTAYEGVVASQEVEPRGVAERDGERRRRFDVAEHHCERARFVGGRAEYLHAEVLDDRVRDRVDARPPGLRRIDRGPRVGRGAARCAAAHPDLDSRIADLHHRARACCRRPLHGQTVDGGAVRAPEVGHDHRVAGPRLQRDITARGAIVDHDYSVRLSAEFDAGVEHHREGLAVRGPDRDERRAHGDQRVRWRATTARRHRRRTSRPTHQLRPALSPKGNGSGGAGADRAVRSPVPLDLVALPSFCINPKVVSERLGHAGITITLDTYSHVSEPMHTCAADAVAPRIAAGGSRPSE